ncbi:YIP1 family protein [candidate division KSB1 bacterium]|nr:YIP1 family protein [candidate division KSB1 bacterium]
MNAETMETKEMGLISRIVGIFSAPTETFESINRKPTWLMPFLIVVILTITMQYFVRDIGMKDQVAKMEARGMSDEQLEMVKKQMSGPAQYIGIVAIPVVTLAIWAIISGILMLGTNTAMGGQATFKKMFAVQAWSSLVGMLGGILKTVLIISKGSTQGVATSLAIILPTPALAETPPVMYRLLSKFDVFTIWALVLWVIGIAAVGNLDTKKSATVVIAIWVLWIILSVALGGVLGPMFGG